VKIKDYRRSFKALISFGVTCLILFAPTLSMGWGAGGHMMTASIAFDRLNPRAKAKANELLAIEINPVSETRKSKNFIDAGHWADDLRPFAEFDSLKPLHFIDLPFSTDGTALPTDQPPPDNIVKALEDNVNILRTSPDKNAQAMALRLIIHFVGDIHQPLHCVTRVSRANPEGDRGGNLFRIKVPGPDGQPRDTNLHSYWDNGIGTFPRSGPNFTPPPLSEIPAAVAQAKKGNPATNRKIRLNRPKDFPAWANESFMLAKNVVYVGVQEGNVPSARYQRGAIKVARQRVAWGGYRLAALLNSIWP
jgi:S1/P1 Nuclease